MENLASAYRDQGKWPEAERLRLQAISSRKKPLGPHAKPERCSEHTGLPKQERWDETERVLVPVVEQSIKIEGYAGKLR